MRAGAIRSLFSSLFRIGICLPGISLLMSCGKGEGIEDTGGFPPFPAERTLEGISPDGAAHEFPGRALFEYVNGEGEVILEYGFISLKTQAYLLESSGEAVTVDVYAMENDKEAFGLYSLYRNPEAETLGIGSEGMRQPYQLLFRKGRFVVKVITYSDAPEAEEGSMRTARWIADRIGGEDTVPDMAVKLQKFDARATRVTYFHGRLVLESRRYITEENILGLYSGTECMYASLNDGSEIVIVRYPDERRRAEATALAEKYFSVRQSGRESSRTWSASEAGNEILYGDGAYNLVLFLNDNSIDTAPELLNKFSEVFIN